MEIKIDYKSLLCIPAVYTSAVLIVHIVAFYFPGNVIAQRSLAILTHIMSGIMWYCVMQISRDGNYIIGNDIHSIRCCKRYLVLNDSYKTRWLRRCKYNDACQCANFVTCTVWLKHTAGSYITITIEENNHGKIRTSSTSKD